jgi:uncharacterized membrane protein
VAILGIGVVLSHYSTTYTMLALIIMVLGLRYGLQALAWVASFNRRLQFASIMRWRRPEPSAVTKRLVVVLLAASYIWSVQLTNTGGNILKVAESTIQSIQTGLAGDTKSSDTSYSFFGGAKLTDQQRLDEYVKETSTHQKSTIAGSLYPPHTYAGYHPLVDDEPNLPLTSIGKFLKSLHFPVAQFNTAMRQGSALALQLLLGVGILVIFVRRTFSVRYGYDYRLFQVASVIMVAAIVLLPVLSGQYGLLRAFQQTLIIGGVPIALASLLIIPKRWPRLRNAFGVACAVGFLLSSTGVITTTLGGYPPQLHLANSGKYYDLYYPHTTEEQGIDWLHSAMLSNPDAAITGATTDRYPANLLRQFSDIEFENDIFPSVLPRDAYVFLGHAATAEDRATLYTNGDSLIYQYPTSFLDNNKDLIYASSGSRVYR